MTDMTAVLNLEPEAVRCPYPAYDALRERGPVVFDENAGFFVVTGFEAVAQVTSRPAEFSSANPMGPSVLPAAQAIEAALVEDPDLAARMGAMNSNRGAVLFTADPPNHTRQRKLLSRALTPRAVVALEPDIRRICAEAVDAFVERGSVEFVGEFAAVISALTLGVVLGVRPEDTANFVRWGNAINSSIGSVMPPEQIRTCIADQLEFMTYFDREIELRRVTPTSDMLSAIANAQHEDEEPFSSAEVLGIVSQIVSAGVETTAKLITSAMKLLCDRPDLQRELAGNPPGLTELLEEVVRLEAPIQGLFRIATTDTTIGDTPIPAGSMIWVVFAAANRDAAEFPAPGEFDPARENRRSHASFGHGVHFCVGAPLARLEARIALETILTRLADLRVTDEREVTYERNYMIHGITRLPLVFSRRDDLR